ncbi:hypothetical protein [Microvirga lotononidis]|uniref:DUF4365 domain-containing protein n=1 Tax=Microvirga lotononidis TaxID=864069 RepID=I4YMN4_9HYPH|nr:hypothetical protein [Microvirga lotononidis]EIM25226.1 hypothetical protein MicloDRAFT_00059480 [Microvirga lotononidis]WQO29288.1 hypothetical protein U0023_09570 [Microvirga lotononidis]
MDDSDQLDSDQLGEKGENRFREMCADAKLVCNASNRDRTGWDFIVEFPFSKPEGQHTLDKRSTPISCHIQMKTMWETSESFKMRLSSAERLAKELKPSFVYVLKIDEKLQPVEAYLIHVLGDNLGTILKRLRAEQSKGELAINQKTISMTAHSAGERLEPTGAALRQALERLCGPDIQVYVEEKKRQIKGLGYEPFSYEAKVNMLVSSKGEFVDAFLGLREIEVTDFRMFETRFGIKLPINDGEITRGVLRIEPTPADQCKITVRGTGITPPAVFQGEALFPGIPALELDFLKAIIRSEFFTLTFEGKKMTFANNAEAINSKAYTLDEWAAYFRLATILASGRGTMAIKPTKGSEFTFPIEAKIEEAVPGEGAYFQDVVDRLSGLLVLAGAPTSGRFTFEHLAEQAEHIKYAGRLLGGATDLDPITFMAGPVEGAELPERVQCLYCNVIELGDSVVAYSAVTEMVTSVEDGRIRWTSSKMEPNRVQALSGNPADFQEFVEKAKAETGLTSTITLAIQHPE